MTHRCTPRFAAWANATPASSARSTALPVNIRRRDAMGAPGRRPRHPWMATVTLHAVYRTTGPSRTPSPGATEEWLTDLSGRGKVGRLPASPTSCDSPSDAGSVEGWMTSDTIEAPHPVHAGISDERARTPPSARAMHPQQRASAMLSHVVARPPWSALTPVSPQAPHAGVQPVPAGVRRKGTAREPPTRGERVPITHLRCVGPRAGASV
jgi:hypothetical protein